MWASNRMTTRVENIVYSLIEIFDVSLTIAYYGREGQCAFYRLMEAIINRRGSGKPWRGRGARPLTMPPSQSRLVVTRPSEKLALQPEVALVWRGDRNFMTKQGLQSKLFIADLPSLSMKLLEKAGGTSVECTHYRRCIVGVVDYWCFDTSGKGVL